MERWRARGRPGLLVLLTCATVLAGCVEGATTGAFVPVDRIEPELRRGVSTRADVQRLLGAPKGQGGMVFPEDRRELEVWYYEDIEVTQSRKVAEGVIHADLRQQILLVTFDGDVFDGFIWFSTAGQVRPR